MALYEEEIARQHRAAAGVVKARETLQEKGLALKEIENQVGTD